MWPKDHNPPELKPIDLPPVTMSEEMKAAMPRRQTLFWDVDPAKIDPEKNAVYVIERIMDFGHDDEARWMWKAYPRQGIHRVAERSRALRADTKYLWTALSI